jgi:hypothetical protein
MSKKKMAHEKKQKDTFRETIKAVIAKVVLEMGKTDCRELRDKLKPLREKLCQESQYRFRIWRCELYTQLGIKTKRKEERRLKKDKKNGQKHLFDIGGDLYEPKPQQN